MSWERHLKGRPGPDVNAVTAAMAGLQRPAPPPDRVPGPAKACEPATAPEPAAPRALPPAGPFPLGPIRVPEPVANPLELPPLSLAYLGDSVYELFVRSRLLDRGLVRVGRLHRAAVGYVRARGQAQALAAILPSLSPEEQEIVRRGRNAKSHAAPKGSNPAEYAAATAFETLLGYLYLAGREERLGQVLAAAAAFIEGEL